MMALQLQLRAFNAVLRKNIKIYSTYLPWLVNSIFGPIVWLGITIYGYIGIASPQSIQAGFQSFFSGPLTGFLILGQSVFSFFTSMNWGAGFAIERERIYGTFEMVLLAPFSRVTLVLGEAIFEAIDSGWAIFLAAYVSAEIFGASFHVGDVFALGATMVLTASSMIALGLFFSAFYVLSRSAASLAIGLQFPTRFFSGTSFPVQALPVYLQYVSYALPVTHGLNVVRRALLEGATLMELVPELSILLGFTIIFSILGIWMIHMMERLAKDRGALHTY